MLSSEGLKTLENGLKSLSDGLKSPTSTWSLEELNADHQSLRISKISGSTAIEIGISDATDMFAVICIPFPGYPVQILTTAAGKRLCYIRWKYGPSANWSKIKQFQLAEI